MNYSEWIHAVAVADIAGNVSVRCLPLNFPKKHPKAYMIKVGSCLWCYVYVPLTHWRWFDFAITHISHRPQPEYTRD